MNRTLTALGGCLLLVACAKQPPSLPAVPPVPDDMPHAHEAATWSSPDIQPMPLPSPPQAPLSPSAPRPAGPHERVYHFQDGKEYTAEIAPGWPLAIVLEPGERFTGLVGGGQPVIQEGEPDPWSVKQTDPSAPQPHVFLTVTKPGLSMGLVITTDKRTYYVTAKSVPSTRYRAMRWTYPAAPVATTQPPQPTIFPGNGQSYYLHVGYQIEAPWPVPDWVPMQVVDNGAKMFIVFPVTMLHQEAPMLRGIGANGPYLLNSRQINRVLIVDHLAPRLELRVGVGKTAQVVTITRQQLQRVTCPGNPQCPVWPQEPAWVAERSTK